MLEKDAGVHFHEIRLLVQGLHGLLSLRIGIDVLEALVRLEVHEFAQLVQRANVPAASLTDAKYYDELEHLRNLVRPEGGCEVCVSEVVRGGRDGWKGGAFTANIVGTLRDELRQGL